MGFSSPCKNVYLFSITEIKHVNRRVREDPDDLKEDESDEHLAGHNEEGEVECVAAEDGFIQEVHR